MNRPAPRDRSHRIYTLRRAVSVPQHAGSRVTVVTRQRLASPSRCRWQRRREPGRPVGAACGRGPWRAWLELFFRIFELKPPTHHGRDRFLAGKRVSRAVETRIDWAGGPRSARPWRQPPRAKAHTAPPTIFNQNSSSVKVGFANKRTKTCRLPRLRLQPVSRCRAHRHPPRGHVLRAGRSRSAQLAVRSTTC